MAENNETSIAVMATDIKYIKDSLAKINEKFELIEGNYMHRREVEKMKEEADRLHEKNEARIRDIELDAARFQTTVKTWGIVMLVFVGIFEFLINKFF